ncbi:lanthionine synthetase C family protein [Streptomyces sp. NEAU-YJ-81]|uniref:lanthionine synthetase C family protein n=1 Tax=Streptomyces sp. NEAU-YJ-81 TaxID=2820288 RepID=UPI001ABCEBCB|nr:lanthionine synthetase C family protein [Streptomyces sp. NEAU-YJ-81]MBO3682832.1 lanthionine synthetase C family protein [Streptomyces sp. NEAU-YJ-81]
MTTHAHHLGTGQAGTLLRRAVLARSDSAWEAAHRTARVISTQPVTAHPDHASLYCGAPALAYALHTARHPAYRSALETLDETVAGLVSVKLTAARERMTTGRPPRMREYDLINGLTGLGAYLLHRRTRPELLEYVLRYIVRLLLQPVTVDGRAAPGWWTSDSPNGRPDQAWPYGHGNFGLAHGVAGPVALLALCVRAGFRVPRQQQALVHACRLLEQWSSSVPAGGTAWPETITAERWHQGPAPSTTPGRPSWCYGTPGIARALQLAALACDRPSGRRHAEHALAACLTDSSQLDSLGDATVCHGWAGLALVVATTAADAAPGSPLPGQVPLLRDRLAAHVDQHPMTDTAGLLTGSDGVLLTLHTLTPARPVAPTWTTCLLLN